MDRDSKHSCNCDFGLLFLVFYRYRINSFYNDAERRAVSLRQLT